MDPGQKERIIQALKSTGHVVGSMGDGINDSPALLAANVGISVENADDIARDAVETVLLQPDLSILGDGIDEGRKTFANTQKYILTTTSSANFGNMLSMAAASFFLPFLPLLALQILLNNFLSDIPGTTIASDNVAPGLCCCLAALQSWQLLHCCLKFPWAVDLVLFRCLFCCGWCRWTDNSVRDRDGTDQIRILCKVSAGPGNKSLVS